MSSWRASFLEPHPKIAHRSVDIARAEGNHDVTFLYTPFELVDNGALVGHVGDVVVSVLADRLREATCRDAGNGRLTGCVDVGHDDDVGLVEGAREPVEEVARAGVAVGLE